MTDLSLAGSARRSAVGASFTLRTFLIAIAAVAIAIAALLNPTPRIATLVVNGVFVAILAAACLAAGMRQPARAFCIGFAVACSGTLVLDGLSQRGFIESDIFTRGLAAMTEDVLPPIVRRGEPGATVYYRTGIYFPVYFYTFGADGSMSSHGQMTMEQARAGGVFDQVSSLDELPHIDNQPTAYMRSQMLPYVLAATIGAVGGLLSYFTRRLSGSAVLAESGDDPLPE